ncbi:thioredoxin [Mycena olivaceomarginata]|nr:thioredoxin [Mycena olivaceomarginata]
MPVTPIENLDEFHKVVNSPTPAIVNFWAAWCGPCKVINPIFENFADKPENAKLKFYKLDADAVPDATNEAAIHVVRPTSCPLRRANTMPSLLE